MLVWYKRAQIARGKKRIWTRAAEWNWTNLKSLSHHPHPPSSQASNKSRKEMEDQCLSARKNKSHDISMRVIQSYFPSATRWSNRRPTWPQVACKASPTYQSSTETQQKSTSSPKASWRRALRWCSHKLREPFQQWCTTLTTTTTTTNSTSSNPWTRFETKKRAARCRWRTISKNWKSKRKWWRRQGHTKCHLFLST